MPLPLPLTLIPLICEPPSLSLERLSIESDRSRPLSELSMPRISRSGSKPHTTHNTTRHDTQHDTRKQMEKRERKPKAERTKAK